MSRQRRSGLLSGHATHSTLQIRHKTPAHADILLPHRIGWVVAFLAQFPPEVGKDVLARLYAGGRFMRRG